MIDISRTKTFAQFITQLAKKYGDQPALVWRPRYRAIRWSYKELFRASQMVARFLEDQKIKKGDRIIIWAGNSPWWVAVFFGCQLKGVTVIPLAPQNTPGFVRKIAKFTEAKLVFKISGLPSKRFPCETVDLENVFDDWENKPHVYKRVKTDADDIAEILFTSGTTGDPKGVILKHRNILSNVRQIDSLQVISSKDRIMSFLPLSHIFEQVAGLFTPLAYGVQITQAASLSSTHLALNMQEDHPTVMTAVPEFLRLATVRVEETAKKEGKESSIKLLYQLGPRLPKCLKRFLAREILHNFGGKLRVIVAGGAALDPEVGRKFEAFGITMLQGYGATETSPVIAANRVQGRKMDSVGQPLPDVDVKIAEDGEIIVKGPNVVDGYYKNPEKTKDAFKNGWYYTDDIGFIDDDGHLHVKGRKKFLIVRPSGENVFPAEIEDLLNKQPTVEDSAVIALTHGDQFEIHAVLLPKRGKKLHPKAIIEKINKQLEPYQRIDTTSIWPEEDFPRTLTRKVKKPIVMEWATKRAKETKPETRSKTGEVEQLLARVSGLSPKQIHPNMRLVRELKMDSLERVAFVAALEEQLGILLDESDITEETTVKQIKERIRDKRQRTTLYGFMEWPLKPLIMWMRQGLQIILLNFIALITSRLRVYGRKNLKDVKAPTLFYANHISFLDGGFVVRALPIRLRYKLAAGAATDATWESKVFGPLTPFFVFAGNLFPVDRKGQIKATLEYSGRLVDRGYSLLFFPESFITKDARIDKLQQGAGFLATEMQLPIVLIYLTGAEKINPYHSHKFLWWRRPRVTVTFGKPFVIDPKKPYRKATKEIEAKMKQLEKEVLTREGKE